MLNQLVIVGRITTIEKIKNEESKEKVIITVAVPRSYKNINGEYETDFIDCILWNNIASNVIEYCNKGDVVGVKGRIQTRTIEEKNAKKHLLEVVADKVTFLNSRKENEE